MYNSFISEQKRKRNAKQQTQQLYLNKCLKINCCAISSIVFNRFQTRRCKVNIPPPGCIQPTHHPRGTPAAHPSASWLSLRKNIEDILLYLCVVFTLQNSGYLVLPLILNIHLQRATSLMYDYTQLRMTCVGIIYSYNNKLILLLQIDFQSGQLLPHL